MIIAICGKSGAGKTTLRELLLKHDKSFTKVISHTTRALRDGEKVGDDYFFIDKETYKTMSFVTTRIAGDDFYGTIKDEIMADTPLFIVDIGGMQQLKQHADFKVIFLDPPVSALMQRLLNRGDKIETIEKRLMIDEEFTIENIQKITDSSKILHIKEEPVTDVLKKSLLFINSQKSR